MIFKKNDFLIACDTTPKYHLNYARKKFKKLFGGN